MNHISLPPELLTPELEQFIQDFNDDAYQLYLSIKNFDYYYQYTDDGSVYRTWAKKEEEIIEALKSLNQPLMRQTLTEIFKNQGKGEIDRFEDVGERYKKHQVYLNVALVAAKLDRNTVENINSMLHNLIKLKELGFQNRFSWHAQKLAYGKNANLHIDRKNLQHKVALPEIEQMWVHALSGYTETEYRALLDCRVRGVLLVTTDEFTNNGKHIVLANFGNVFWPVSTKKVVSDSQRPQYSDVQVLAKRIAEFHS